MGTCGSAPREVWFATEVGRWSLLPPAPGLRTRQRRGGAASRPRRHLVAGARPRRAGLLARRPLRPLPGSGASRGNDSGVARGRAGRSTCTPDAGGVLWLATSEGIHRFGDGRLSLVHPARAWGEAPVAFVHHDRRNRLWIGTAAGLCWTRGAGLVRHRGSRRAGPAAVAAHVRGARRRIVGGRATGRCCASVPGRPACLGPPRTAASDAPPSVLEDRDGNVWMATRAGLLRYQIPAAGSSASGRADGLPDDDVSALFEDREGSLWVGTRGGGLAQFTDRTLDTPLGPALAARPLGQQPSPRTPTGRCGPAACSG